MTRSPSARRLHAVRVLLVVVASVLAAVVAEFAVRVADGFALASIELVPIRRPVVPPSDEGKWLDPAQAAQYASRVPLAPGVNGEWFAVNPDPLPPSSVDAELNRRYRAAAGHELASVYEWNRVFVSSVLCRGDGSTHPFLARQLEALRDVYVFDPESATPFPTYRFLRRTHYPSGLRTNTFGWRGPDIALNKEPGRVRIAFVGASTTVEPHADPFSYPEYIGRWLAEWQHTRHLPVSFDVVNAGREGILSSSIAAVVRDELLPVHPDFVVYYEGINQFWPNSFTNRPIVRVLQAVRPGGAWDRYSAIAVRLHHRLEPQSSGAEPAKPSIAVAWPRDLDEFDPPLDDARLPVQLPEILRDLDRIRDDLRSIDGTLMLSSFTALVHDGLVLSPRRDRILYAELNGRYWPFTYAHMRRFLDFENRTFRKYARVHALPFNDLAAEYPPDARLFVDTVHMTPAGVRLKAWIVFQHLVAEIDRRLRDGRLPRLDPGGRTVHPAFAGAARQLVSVDALKRQCR